MRKPLVLLFSLVSTTLLFVNCSSDSSLPLNSGQSNSITEEIADSMGLVVGGSISAGSGLSAANLITVDVSISSNCEGGGTKKATGTQAGVDGTAIDGTTDVKVKFTDCVVNVSSTQTVTINGTLDIGGNFDVAAAEGGLAGDSAITFVGSLELTGDDLEKEGTCEVDFTSTANAQGLTIDVGSVGKLCGNDIDHDHTINL